METTKLEGYGPRVKMTVLDNGATVITFRDLNTKLASYRLTFATGSMHDATPGEAHFLEHMIFEGPSRGHLHAKLQAFGTRGITRLNANTEENLTRYFATTFARHGDDLLKCLLSIVSQPEFRTKDLEGERSVIRSEINQDRSRTFRSFELPRLAFPDRGAKHPVIGYESSVAKITRDSLLERYASTYTASNLMVFAAGDVHHKRIVDVVKKHSEKLKQGHKRPLLQTWHRVTNGHHEFRKPFINSNELQLVFNGFDTRDFRGRILWSLVGNLLLNPKYGSIFHELRMKRRLAYNITSYSYDDPIDSTNLHVSGLERNRMDEAEQRIHAVLRNNTKNGFDQKKIDLAKTDLLLTHAIEGYSRRSFDALESDLLYGSVGKRPNRYKLIRSATNKELTSVLKTLYDQNQYCRFTLLPSK